MTDANQAKPSGPDPQTSNNACRVALDLIGRDISPVPVPKGEKNPNRKKWQLLRITAADVPKFFGKDSPNVGALMGLASGGLTDMDLDCKEAVQLAPYFLPRTGSIYGRPSKKRSHYLYTCFDPDPKAGIKFKDELGGCIVELRMGGGGKGSQSVMPGSIHTSGELYQWDEDDKRREIKFVDLKAAATKIAVGTVLLRHWPAKGSRHDAAITIGGFLARAGWTPDDIEHFVSTVCHVHGEADSPDAHGKTARDAAQRFVEGGEVHGLPMMIETFGELPAKQIAKLLCYKSKRGGPAPEAPEEIDGLPTVQFGKLSTMSDRTAEILIEAKVPFYQRGDKLVRPVVNIKVDTFKGKTTTTAQLVEVDLHYMRDMMCRKSQWIKFDQRANAWIDIHPPQEVALIVLNRYGDWTFQSIAGIIGTPTLRPNGTILSEAGYDPETRLLLVDPPKMPAIQEKPTREDAEKSLGLLKDLLVEFPFSDVDANKKSVSRSVALSGMLTTVCRAAFPVAPMHIGDATAPATGKSYLLSLIAAIATGRLMPVISAGKSEEEMEKRIGAAVIMGQSFVCIDNVNGEIGGDALCQLVEQPRPSVRVLGLSKLVEVEASSVTFFADGNNIVVTGDLSRRAIVFKLDAKLERPELRTFTGDPMKSVMDDRGKYIAACLTICRAYIAADRPNPMPQIASFNDWSNVVRSALVWLGEEDPVKSMDTSSAEDPVKNALLTMLTAWIEVMGTSATLREVIDQCNAVASFDVQSKTPTYAYPELRSAVSACTPRRPLDIDTFGKWMRSNKGRIINGMCFDKQPGSSGGPTIWLVKRIADTEAQAEARAKKAQAEVQERKDKF